MAGWNPLFRARPQARRKIVIFSQGSCPAEHCVSTLGGRPVRHLPLVNGIVADFPAGADLRMAAEIPEVLRVDEDIPIHLVHRLLRGGRDCGSDL